MLDITNIYNSHKDKTFKYVLSKINNTIVTEELVDDIFIKVFKHLENYNEIKSKGKFEVWLFEITNNTIIDYYRKKKIINDEFNDDNVQQYVNNDDQYSFNHNMEFNEINNIIITEIKKLPKSKVMIAKLFFIEELSYEEISEAMNIPLGTVKGTLNRVRKDIKDILQNNYKINSNILL